MVRSWGVWILRVNSGKVRDTGIKWSIISKSVTIIIFVEFIDQLIDYPIHRASLRLTLIKSFNKILEWVQLSKGPEIKN